MIFKIFGRMTALAEVLLLVVAFADILGAQAQKTLTAIPGPIGPGLRIGEKIPDFSARDQEGNRRDFEDLRGSSGLFLLVYRSADW